MQYVIKKLMMASASADLRRQMDVEEEFFSEIDTRDAKLKVLGKKVDEQEQEIEEQKQELQQKDKKLDEQSQKLDEQSQKLNEQNQMIRSMAQSMLQAGMSVEEIAKVTKMDVEKIRDVLK